MASLAVGERPRQGMAHIFYPQHQHVQFHGRSEHGLQSLPTWEADRQELLDRWRSMCMR
jgi:hypothetical protein